MTQTLQFTDPSENCLVMTRLPKLTVAIVVNVCGARSPTWFRSTWPGLESRGGAYPQCLGLSREKTIEMELILVSGGPFGFRSVDKIGKMYSLLDPEEHPMSRATSIAIGIIGLAVLGAGMTFYGWGDLLGSSHQDEEVSARLEDQPLGGFGAGRGAITIKKFPIDAERTMGYLKQLCEIGPRVSATPGMLKQQQLLTAHFKKYGGSVNEQQFQTRQASQRQPVTMTNMIVSWFPERKRRIIFCTHYDTRPAAHEEPQRNWDKPFISANDGTSGVALLMELAHHMKDFPTGVGVDFIFFDGEEYIFDMGTGGLKGADRYFLGSEHFASEYKKNLQRSGTTYEAAILLDLFAHKNARLAMEGYSVRFAPKLVLDVWNTAQLLGAKSFVREQGFRRGNEVSDDHLALLEVGIPAIDVIDFDYKHWHKLTDTLEQCSGEQMSEVGQVLLGWLQLQK